MIHPIILKQKGSVLKISGESLQKLLNEPKQILWCNDGLYGMIPVERVKNAISVLQDRRRHSIIKALPLIFTWSETIEIPQETGRVMEKFNGGEESEFKIIPLSTSKLN